MPFQEDFDEFLDIEQGLAVEAIVLTAFGLSYKVRGIFVNDYYSIDIGEVGVRGSNPTFECAEMEVGDIEYGDRLTIKHEKYRIIGVKPDSNSWVLLELEKQS